MKRLILVLAIIMIAGCASDETTTDTTAPATVPFVLHTEPEFVQGAIPGSPTGVLVSIEDASETNEPVEITATATDAEVTISPTTIRSGEVAEITIIAGPGTTERVMEITIVGRRGTFEVTETKSVAVLPWEDDRGPYANTLMRLFTAWLADNRPDLGITPTTEFTGSFVAPQLLVVSHYLFLSEEWEIGLSWHVMIPPDDWAEIYLRPRNELHPTLTFRLSSQDAALTEGRIEIAPAPIPTEVTR